MESNPKHLYEYAVVRYVPNIEREEFVNVGLVMMCKRRGWIKAQFLLNPKRISAMAPGAELELLENQLLSFRRIADADNANGGPIASLDAHERFRWLTAVRSASLQTSRPHCGLTDDLDTTFSTLFTALVE